MAMTASSGVAQGAGSVPAGQAERSPFVADDRAAGTLPAGQAIDYAVIRRAAAPGPGFCRAGPGKTHRRFRPLSPRQGHRAVPARGRKLAVHPVRPAAAGRSRERNSGAERQPRRAVLRGDHRRPLCRPAQGQARDPDAQPVLSGLRRRRPRRRLRTDLPADHARQRILAGSRCARRRDAGPNGCDLHRLARQSARRGRLARLLHPLEETRRPLSAS